MKQLLFVLALEACILAQAFAGPDDQTPQVTETLDSVTMQLVGNSGQIKLFPASDSNRFIRIKISKVQEVDSDEKPIRGRGSRQNTIDFASLASGNKCGNGAGWSPLEKKNSSSGVVYYTSTFTCAAIPQATSNTVTFKMRVDLFSQSDNVLYGNKTVTVYKNTVKFSTAVTNWMFDVSTNKLQFSVFMGSQGKGGAPLKGVDSSLASKCTPVSGKPCAGGRRIQFDNSFLDFPSFALAGPGCSIDTSAGSPTCSEFPVTPSLTTTGNIQEVQLSLPSGCTGSGSCISSNFYDPVIGSDSSPTTASSSSSISVGLALAIVAMSLTL